MYVYNNHHNERTMQASGNPQALPTIMIGPYILNADKILSVMKKSLTRYVDHPDAINHRTYGCDVVKNSKEYLSIHRPHYIVTDVSKKKFICCEGSDECRDIDLIWKTRQAQYDRHHFPERAATTAATTSTTAST
jgi:hypothetical protein